MKKCLKDLFAKIGKLMLVLSAVSLILGAFVQVVWSATYYMPDDFASLRVAVAGMQSGDTLIIRDGTYSGSNNVLNQLVMPPSGTADQFTTIRAEHDGLAIFPDGFIQMDGNATRSYISFEGLKALDYTMIYGAGINHFKFLRCAFTYDETTPPSTGAPFWIGYGCSYILVEDCWAWGAGRYKFVTGGHHNVFRRCVARYDRTDWTDPMANFSAYDGDYIAFQNCIAIDSDHEEFWLNTSEVAGTFYIHHGSENNSVKGCISVNNHNPWLTGSPGPGIEIENNSAIDIGNIGELTRADTYSTGNFVIKNCTLMDISGDGLHPWGGSTGSVSALNNVLYGIGGTALYGTNLGGVLQGYNVLYNNATDFYGGSSKVTDYCAAQSNAIDPTDGTPGNGTPAILYPVRVERGSNLSGTGANGSDRGATILYRIGVSGTFYGQAGWDSITTEPLWPWSNEARIRADMRAYSYTGLTVTGAIRTLSGARGFCADGKQLNGVDDITLTSYIWEYLGNPIPSEIYGSEQPVAPEADTTPPVISAIVANNLTATSATISWTTNELATSQVKYGLTTAYDQQSTEASLVTSHQVTLAGLQSGTIYHYKVKSSDGSGNSAESSDFTFTTNEVESVSDTTALSSLQDFEDGVLWLPGGSQDSTGNGRGWAFLTAGTAAKIEIDSSIGANKTHKSLKVTFDSDDPQIYFRSDDKTRDHMPEATGANRMSFYVRFPEAFPIQPLPFRYDTWQLGTYVHDPDDWYDIHEATFEEDHGIHHYYHRLTIEQVGDGWVKYIVNIHPDQANYSGSTVPPVIPYYFNSFGRFYFHFGPQAGGPVVPRPFTIWIDEIKFYYDDGSVGGQIHDGGQDDAGFNGAFFPDSADSISPPANFMKIE